MLPCGCTVDSEFLDSLLAWFRLDDLNEMLVVGVPREGEHYGGIVGAFLLAWSSGVAVVQRIVLERWMVRSQSLLPTFATKTSFEYAFASELEASIAIGAVGTITRPFCAPNRFNITSSLLVAFLRHFCTRSVAASILSSPLMW